jgi:hypothetical protein
VPEKRWNEFSGTNSCEAKNTGCFPYPTACPQKGGADSPASIPVKQKRRLCPAPCSVPKKSGADSPVSIPAKKKHLSPLKNCGKMKKLAIF